MMSAPCSTVAVAATTAVLPKYRMPKVQLQAGRFQANRYTIQHRVFIKLASKRLRGTMSASWSDFQGFATITLIAIRSQQTNTPTHQLLHI